jgi:hypothetical protein
VRTGGAGSGTVAVWIVRLRLLAGWAALASLAVLAAPAPAGAHVRTGAVAVDYRAQVFPLPVPLRAAVSARVYKTDQALGLTVGRGHTVVVLGYTGEPFVRIDDAGVAVNRASPTASAVGLLRATRPAGAAAKGWLLLRGRRTLIWHDARVRGLPPELERGTWAVPLVVDGHRVRLAGEIWRVHVSWPWRWLAFGLPFVALALWLLTRRRGLLRPAAVALGVSAAAGTVATAAAFALAASASGGRWVEAANEVVFALVGLGVVARGSPDARSVAGGALGLLALAVGLSKVPVFLHGVVLSGFPATLTRVAVAFTISAGAAATAIGLGVFADLLEPQHEPSVPSGPLGRPSS